MNKITLEQWRIMTFNNCACSYNLTTQAVIMLLWEGKAKTQVEARKILELYSFGLSGAQAEMAISFALGNDPSEWLGKVETKI